MAQTLTEELNLIITAESNEAKETLKNLEQEVDKLGKTTEKTTKTTDSLTSSQNKNSASAKSLGEAVATTAARYLALGVAIQKAYSFVMDGIRDAEAENRSLVALQVVLENTGRLAEISVGKIDAIASELEDSFYADKQAIMDAASELAIMEGIASSLFERTLKAGTELSFVLKKDVGSSISDLSKALEDPLTGLTKLERQGIFISQEIKNQITSLIEQNRLYEAQSLILDEIERKVGGTAEKMADVSSLTGMQTAFDKMKGSSGQLFSTLFSGLFDLGSFIFNKIDESNNTTLLAMQLRRVQAADIGTMDAGQIADLIATANALKEIGTTENSLAGNALKHWESLQVLTEQRLGVLQNISAEERAAIKAAEEAAKKEEDRLKKLEEEKGLTEALKDVWRTTDEGRLAELQDRIAEYKSLLESDRLTVSISTDSDVRNQAQARLEMYGDIIGALEKELEAMVDKEADAIEQILGRSASDFVLNIPLSFDFGRSEEETLDEQISTLKAAINTLWNTAVDSDQLDQWQEALDILKGKYDELALKKEELLEDAKKQKEISEEEAEKESELLKLQTSAKTELDRLLSEEEVKQKKLEEYQISINGLLSANLITQEQYNQLLEKEKETLGFYAEEKELASSAEKELLKLLSDEEKARNSLKDYESVIGEMLEKKLITQEQYNQLLEKEKEMLGLVEDTAEKISDWERTLKVVNEEFSVFLDSNTSAEMIASRISDIFYKWGDAIASGEDAGQAISDMFGDWVQSLTSQMSTMFITAGLRCIIEGGWSGLGVGLALIAAGGLSGFSSGLLGGSSSALSDDIMSSMQDEMDARQKLVDTITEGIDTEYDLLKRQLERNLISEETFITEAGNLNQQKNEAEARVDISNILYDRIQSLNSEYASMSGWDKFWSGRDEDIKKEIAQLQTLFDLVDSATTEELRELVETLRNLGLKTGTIPSFATGGDFITNGPQLILVGDNPGGRERVRITPIAHESAESSSSGGNIYIVGDVYGLEDLNGKLKLINEKTTRRRS